MNQFARQFVTDYAFVGSYEITYRIYLVDYPENSTEQTTPFTVTILNSCTSPLSITSPVLVDQEYTLTDANMVYGFESFVADPPICDIMYTYSLSDAVGNPVVAAFDGA